MTVCGLLRLDGADVRRSELTGMLAASSIGLPAARQVHLDGSFGVVTAADDVVGSMPPVLVGPSGLVIVIADQSTSARVVQVGRAAGGRATTATAQSGPATGFPRPSSAAAGDDAAAVAPVLPVGRDTPMGPARPFGAGGFGAPAARQTSAAFRLGSGAGSVTVLRPTSLRGPSAPSVRPDDLGSGGAGERDQNARVAAALMRSYATAGQRALGSLGEHLLAVVWEPARRRLIVSRGGRRADELVIRSDGRYFAFGVEQAQVLAAGPLGAVRPRRLGAGETLPVTVATRLRRPLAAELPRERSNPADVPVT